MARYRSKAGIIPVPLQGLFLSSIHALQACPSFLHVDNLSRDLWLHASRKLTVQIHLSLGQISRNKGKNVLFFEPDKEGCSLLPPWPGQGKPCLLQVPSLKQRSAQLTGCQHSQNSTQSLSQNRNIPEGGGKLLQVKVRVLPISSALDQARLWGLQSVPLWQHREFQLKFWPGSRQDEQG